MKHRQRFLLLLIVIFSASLQAADPVRLARYSTLEPVATQAQETPLQVVVQIRFPRRITTLRKAFEHLLRRSGYRMATAENTDPKLEALLRKPLPEVHRQLGPITLERALRTLAGAPWTLVVDPVHRLLSFELAKPYWPPIASMGPSSRIKCQVTPTLAKDEGLQP